jgi:hypothetical protein
VDASVCLCATRGGELLACVGAYDGSVYFLRVADGTVRRDCHAAYCVSRDKCQHRRSVTARVTRQVAWEFRTDGGEEVKCLASAEPGPAHAGTVWVGAHDKTCYALSVAALPGRCVHRLRTGGNVIARPCCTRAGCGGGASGGVALRVLVASQDGVVRAVEKTMQAHDSGAGPRDPGAPGYRLAWEVAVGAPVFAGVVAVDGVVRRPLSLIFCRAPHAASKRAHAVYCTYG